MVMPFYPIFRQLKFKKYNLLLYVVVSLTLYCFIHNGIITRFRAEFNAPYYNSSQAIYQVVDVDFGSSATGKILQKRRNQLLSYCRGKELETVGHNTDTVLKKHFFHDIKHKFVYCTVQKIGSTFWRRLLKIISGNSKESSPFDIVNEFGKNAPTFKDSSFDYIHAVLQDSLKFIIVRDPYSRLFSAFANKFFLVNPKFRAVVGNSIIRFTRVNASEKSLRCGHDVTFPEIVKFVIITEKRNWGRDDHFTPISDHCRPCQIKYDIIAKVETYKEDTLYVLDRLNATNIPHLMKDMHRIEEGTELDIIAINSRHLIEDIKQLPGCVSIAEGLRRAWRNFQFTGVISNDIKYPLSANEEEAINNIQLREIFEKAFRASGPRELRSKNRQLVLEEAYSQVPLPDLMALSELFKTDCDAFGYDCKPDYIFKRNEKPKSNLLDIWGA